MTLTTMTGTSGIVQGTSGVAGVLVARGGGRSTLIPVAVKPVEVAPWRVRIPGSVDHNWTGVSVPDGRCRPPA